LLGFLSSVRSRLKWLFIINEDLQSYFEGDRQRLGFQGQIHFLNSSDFLNIKEQLNNKWSSIVVGLRPQEIQKNIADILLEAKFSGQKVIDLSRFYEQQWYKVPVYFLGPEWFIGSEGFESISHPISLKLKRLFDIFISATMLAITSPLMLLTAIAIKLESPGAALYKQIRTGKDGQPFAIIKFRSMRSDAEKAGAQWAQKNDSRITKVGKFIRLTRLDELPQLWNVLKGDMSFVGPRPERPEFNEMLAKEIPFYNLRHTIQPGLTGWAQVLYPYGASVDDSREKLQYELYYAKHYSLIMDFIIFVKTVSVVLFGRGR
jgi:exopolysaccharide biosynthesis polyprenyl glycosylphosphotransferase